MKVPIIKLGIWVSTSLVVSSSLITWLHGKVSPVISSYLTVMVPYIYKIAPVIFYLIWLAATDWALILIKNIFTEVTD